LHRNEDFVVVLDLNLLRNVFEDRIMDYPSQLFLGLIGIRVNVNNNPGISILDPLVEALIVPAFAGESGSNLPRIGLNSDLAELNKGRFE
jgi:hypothetical protein